MCSICLRVCYRTDNHIPSQPLPVPAVGAIPLPVAEGELKDAFEFTPTIEDIRALLPVAFHAEFTNKLAEE